MDYLSNTYKITTDPETNYNRVLPQAFMSIIIHTILYTIVGTFFNEM